MLARRRAATGSASRGAGPSPALPNWVFRAGAAKRGATSICARSKRRRCSRRRRGRGSIRRCRSPARGVRGRWRGGARGSCQWLSFARIIGGAGLPAGLRWSRSARRSTSRPRSVETALEALSGDRDQPFAALNAGFFTDGFVLEVGAGPRSGTADRNRPCRVRRGSGIAAHPQPRFAGRDSRVRLIETFAGEGRYWRNDVVA